jgi:flagellar basal body P-ring formation protein FlgA
MKRAHLLLTFAAIGLAALACKADAADGNRQDPEAIRLRVVTYLRSTVADSGSNVRIEVSSLDPRLHLAACGQPLVTTLAPGSRETGHVTVDVRCRAPQPWQIFVPARVQHRARVLVTIRPLARYEIVRSGDVMLADRDVAGVLGDYLTGAGAAVGKRMKRAVGPGIALTRAMVQNQPVIHRGDNVTILAEGGGIAVRVAGEALSDAAAGDTVRVRNIQTRRVVEGTAVAAGTVKVMM